MAIGSFPVALQTGPDLTALHIRAFADRGVDQTTLYRARAVAQDLLSSAGVVTAWRICQGPASCQVEDRSVPEVVVILSSQDRADGRENCGFAALGKPEARGTVVVSVPCLARVAFRLTRRRGTGTHPLLAMPRHDDIVGAVVAHEIGHVLGLRHAPLGLMRAELEAEDVVALRQGNLRFSREEAVRMHAAGGGPSGSTTYLPYRDRRR